MAKTGLDRLDVHKESGDIRSMFVLDRRRLFRLMMGTMSAAAFGAIATSTSAESISAESRTALITLYVAMFNSAPDGDTLDTMVSAWESGKTMIEIADTLDNDEFRTSYPAFLTPEEFADRLLDVLFGDGQGGYIVNSNAVNYSRRRIVSSVNSGRSDTQIISQAASALIRSPNLAYTDAIARLSNKVELADAYARTVQTHPKDQEGKPDNSLARSLIANVTPDRSSISTVIDRILDGTLDGLPYYASPA